MERPVITIGEFSYRLTRTPEGKNCCELCDLYNYCINRNNKAEDPECLMFGSGDWHFKKILKDESI